MAKPNKPTPAAKPDAAKAPRKPREKVPENESKAERFRRLAKKRVPRALKALNAVGNLTGAGYEYTDEQRDKIIGALTEALASTVRRLKAEKQAAAPAFEI